MNIAREFAIEIVCGLLALLIIMRLRRWQWPWTNEGRVNLIAFAAVVGFAVPMLLSSDHADRRLASARRAWEWVWPPSPPEPPRPRPLEAFQQQIEREQQKLEQKRRQQADREADEFGRQFRKDMEGDE